MWVSPEGNSNHSTITSRLTCSPSNSKSTCTPSSPPFSPSSPIPTPLPPPPPPASAATSRKSMEEVWKDITLGGLHDHTQSASTSSSASTTTTTSTTTLQDFLATPFLKHLPPLPHNPSSAAADISFLPPPPLTSNDSGSALDFQFLDSNTTGGAGPVKPSPQLQSSPSFVVSHTRPALRTLASSSSVFPSNSTKRPCENGDNSSDRRHKRMIKNRESAARSRARKQEQAYTNELELEVAHLQEENARLRRQQTELCLAAPAQLPKKHTLHRTSTAPF